MERVENLVALFRFDPDAGVFYRKREHGLVADARARRPKTRRLTAHPPLRDAVAAKLKELPVDDLFGSGKVLANGRYVHDLYLFEVKKPSESKKPWDYYKELAVVPGDKAFATAAESGCPLTK